MNPGLLCQEINEGCLYLDKMIYFGSELTVRCLINLLSGMLKKLSRNIIYLSEKGIRAFDKDSYKQFIDK